MKHIYKGLVLCGAFAFSAMQVQAQTTLEDFENLAAELEGDEKVEVAFRENNLFNTDLCTRFSI